MTAPDWARALWQRTERLHGALFFLAGFGWDVATLTRIDRLLDNAILGSYLLALAALLVVGWRVEAAPGAWPRLAPHRGRLELAEQFLFGGLYSGTVIFYSRSATVGRAVVFVGVLVALMLANEFMRPRLSSRRLKVAQFTLCAFSFLLFFVPVVTGWMSRSVVAVAAVGSVALAAGVVALAAAGGPAGATREALRRQAPAALAVFVGLGALEALRLIPPVPLAVVEGGIFHDVSWEGAEVRVRWEDRGWLSMTRDDRHFRYVEGDAVWCFTSVFAPTGAAVEVVHRWERWTEDGWQTTDRIPFSVVGGRGGGFRGYTRKRNLGGAERLRVVVETTGGRELARYVVWIERPEEGPEEGERKWSERVVR